jgi:hypothetical protein
MGCPVNTKLIVRNSIDTSENPSKQTGDFL